MMSRSLVTSVVVTVFALVAIQQVRGTHIEEIDLNPFHHKPRNLVLGERVTGDSVLIQRTIEIDRKIYRWTSYDFKYPELTTNTEQDFITQVVVKNLDFENSGSPTLIHGGPGSSDVSIHISSKWNRGLTYYIVVFGFPKDESKLVTF